MSYQYNQYLAKHKSNVEESFRWLQKNLPEIQREVVQNITLYLHTINQKWSLMSTRRMTLTFMEEIALMPL